MCTDPEDWTGLPAAWVARHQHDPKTISYYETNMAKLKKSAVKARELYDSGAPWWTKEAIRDLDEQLERIRHSQASRHEITRTDLLGNKNEMFIMTDRSLQRHVDLISGRESFPSPNPHIDYKTYQSLCFIHRPFDLGLNHDLFTLSVGQYERQVDIRTGEIVSPFPVYALDELRARFAETRSAFEATNLWKKLLCTLANSFSNIRIMRVRKIIIFASSTPSWNLEDLATKQDGKDWLREWDNAKAIPAGETMYPENDTPIVQLSLGLLLRDYLAQYYRDQGTEAREEEEIKVYAQEPCFTDNDKVVLKENGIEVLEDPHGFLEMDDETAVVCFNADVPVRSLTAELARPAMMIWNKCKPDRQYAPREDFIIRHGERDARWDEDEGVSNRGEEEEDDNDEGVGGMEHEEEEGYYCCQWTDPVTPRVMRMVEEYAEADFPDGPGSYKNFGSDPAIYVRRPKPLNQVETKPKKDLEVNGVKL